MLTTVFERFVKESPISVMARALIERVFQPTMLDEWFAEVADAQYTRTLLFSTVFDLMSLVVCGIHPSVHAAYQAAKKTQAIEVSIQAVYDKLYAEYVTLYDYFGRGPNDVMKRLKVLKAEIRG